MTALSPILEVRELAVTLGATELLGSTSFAVMPGTITALQGRSGTGKSTLIRAVMGTLPPGARATGSVRIGGVEQLGRSERQRRQLRGRVVSVAFQDTLASLNPVQTIGKHFEELTRATGRALSPADWREALQRAGLEPGGILDAYAWELSGGQLQRVGLALALVTGPALLLADEITTALDVVVQREVMDRLRAHCQSAGLALLLVTHDSSVAEHWADNVVSLDRETATAPAPEVPTPNKAGGPVVIEGRRLVRAFHGTHGRTTRALDDVSLAVRAGEAVGVIGRSGAGKSTLLACLAALERPDSGDVLWSGRPLSIFSAEQLRRSRRGVQVVFQNALATFDPRWRVGRIVTEPLEALALDGDRRQQAAEALDLVGLGAAFLDRDPTTLSGGEQQRVAIARAIAPRPEVLLCDEPVASLDPYIRMRIVALLDRLRRQLDMAIVFVTHDLELVPALCSRVVVMAEGRIVDACAIGDIEASAVAETQALLAALPGRGPGILPPREQRFGAIEDEVELAAPPAAR